MRSIPTINSVRRRLALETAVTSAAPAVASAACLLVALALADHLARVPIWARLGGLAIAASLVVVGLAKVVRSVRRHAWTDLGIARFASSRREGGANALATWLEMGSTPMLPAYVATRIERAAIEEASAIDPVALVRLDRTARHATIALAAIALLALPSLAGYDYRRLVAPEPDPAVDGANASAPTAPATTEDRLQIRLISPPYTRRTVETLDAPSEVSALAGSRVEVELAPGAADVVASISLDGGEATPLAREGESLVGSFVVRDAGSLAIRPSDTRGERRPFLVAIAVVEDRAPDVHIVAPTGDLLVLPEARPHALTIECEATDDFGISEMKLRYVRSIGEGDSAEFVDGEKAVEIVSRDGAKTRGRCRLDLDALGVVPGATLVYHVEARDTNAVAGPSTGLSESLVFEVASPRDDAAITIDDLRPEDVARYLLSQRMILEKTLRLHAERKTLERETLVARATEIARDQREFKESFDQLVEIHGENEIAHEHAGTAATASGESIAERAEEAHEAAVEARSGAHDHGAPEPGGASSRPQNDLLEAVRAMWDAERALGIAETENAIPAERRALEFLKRAQRAVRYTPRVRVTAKPIDLKRRFSGEVDDLQSRVERLPSRKMSPEERELRDALGRLLELTREALAIAPGGAGIAPRARSLSASISDVSSRLLAIEGGYAPATVAAAERASFAAANARRLADALDAKDEKRARTASSGLAEDLVAAASRLAALLDAKPAVGGAPDASRAAGAARRAGGDYFRRLARPSV